VMVNPDLTVPGHPEIFALGDTAHVEIEGKAVPGIAPAAKQEGAYAAHVIRDRLNGKTSHEPFCYRHSGNLATVGPNAAVIDWGRIQLKGRIAWWLWGIAHIYFLIGARSRLTVAISWLWAYLRGQHSARLITQKETLKPE
jgi:NADH:ubiquinone reductase (H+-translocating)